MTPVYDPHDWYWIVSDDETRVWSSARAAYVPADDAGYAAWREMGRVATRIATDQDLTDVLAVYGLRGPVPPPPPGITKAQCLLWLHQLGVSEQDIDTFIEQLPDDGTQDTARIEWRHRPTFRADHPLILAAADEFGIPNDYLTDAFRAAALL